MESDQTITIIGAGNIGTAIARGLVQAGQFTPKNIIMTRRHLDAMANLREEGFTTLDDNLAAVKKSRVVIIAVEPKHLDELLDQIRDHIDEEKHLLISVVSGATTRQILRRLDKKVQIVRAMPNTATAIRESMTCISSTAASQASLEETEAIFKAVGQTLIITEEQMSPATALAACGIAFFLRAIRAASQGGIEIGFHFEEAIHIAAQTARGAASLLLQNSSHPEREIDRVTTPRGCTISGLNQMEHEGFSSAMIKGIVMSSDKAAKLYAVDDEE